MHSVQALRARLSEVEPYPSGVAPVPGALPFTAFFPGGHGLWLDEAGQLPPLPTGGIMIVGHNFHNVAGYQKMRTRNGRDAGSPTWRNLLKMLCNADIAPQGCFFTNAYMGLIDGPSAQGVFPGARDAAFVARCRAFFLEQVRLMQPRLIVTLGAHVPPFLAPFSDELKERWLDARGSYKGLQTLDSENVALVRAMTFHDLSWHTNVAVLTHPAQQWPNVRRRRYGGLESYEAERALLHDGLGEAHQRVTNPLEGGAC